MRVGPGTVLAGRYALRTPSVRLADHEIWSGHDRTLERSVSLLLFPADHPGAEAALDAGRRAAGIDDPRLSRVLDAGAHQQVRYVVTEAHRDAVSLRALLGDGGLPAEEGRRIIGEAASGLHVAGLRGLHHLCLAPSRILRLPSGEVKVTGLAVLAALAGLDGTGPAEASRIDAQRLVGCIYAALTGRWPLAEHVDELPAAPCMAARVAAPSEIAAGVPQGLDAVCRATLVEDAGPVSPGELAQAIAPWASSVIEPQGAEALAGGAANLAAMAGRSTASGADARTGVHAVAGLPDRPAGLRADVAQDGDRVSAGNGADAAHGADGADGAEAAPPDGSGRVAAVVGAVGSARAAAGTVGGKVGTVGGKVGSLARAAADRAASARSHDEQLPSMTLPEALLGPEQPVEPAIPLLGPLSPDQPPRSQTRLVLLILVGFVSVLLLLAYCNLSSLGAGLSLPTVESTARFPSPSASASPSGSTGKDTGAGPIAILDARGFDPQGDKHERDSLAAKAYDKLPDTAWYSEGYLSSGFGNLKKGVGLLFDLGQQTTLHRVTLRLPYGPANLSVYAAQQDKLDGATKLGAVKDVRGTVSLDVSASAPQTRYVIVWFTKAASDGQGKYRAALSEITVR